MKLATMARGGHSDCHSRQFSRGEGGDGGQSGVLFAFGAYLSVCFLSFFFIFVFRFVFLFCINIASFVFVSDFVYFGGRACALALNYL